jgi:hypothetical protein
MTIKFGEYMAGHGDMRAHSEHPKRIQLAALALFVAAEMEVNLCGGQPYMPFHKKTVPEFMGWSNGLYRVGG